MAQRPHGGSDPDRGQGLEPGASDEPGRNWLGWSLLALGLAVLVAAAALAGSRLIDAEDEAANSSGSVAADEGQVDGTADAGLDTDLVRATLGDYADLYSAEDVEGIAALFSQELVRVNLGDPAQDRAEALAEYQEQFSALGNPSYELTEASIDARGAEASADMAYRITDDGVEAGAGTIAFHLVEADGRVLIDEMFIVPAELASETPSPPEPAPSDATAPSDQSTDDYATPVEPPATTAPPAPAPVPEAGGGPTVCPLIFGQAYCFDYQTPSGDGSSAAPGVANPNYYAPQHPRYPELQSPDTQSDYGPGIYR